MRQVVRKVFLSKENLELLDKDINAKTSYTIFSNKEEGTDEIDIILQIPEQFTIHESAIDVLVEDLFPALEGKALDEKVAQVKQRLRSSSIAR